jgi:hypothetical protein
VVRTAAVQPKPQPPIGPIGKKPGSQAPDTGRRGIAVLDVDVYKERGQGKPIGVLKKGSNVFKVMCSSDNWCFVAGSAVPGGKGWVYSGPDYPC